MLEFLSSPRTIGAVWPSSRRLARRMAWSLPREIQGNVVELGGGTGTVTEALLRRGIPRHRLIVVERSPALAAHLRRRFPGVKVIQGDAAHLGALLRDEGRVGGVVSSLPLRSLPARAVSTILREVSGVLDQDGLFIQFTYRLRRRNSLSQRFWALSSRVVWGNLPPARVGVFVNRRHVEGLAAAA